MNKNTIETLDYYLVDSTQPGKKDLLYEEENRLAKEIEENIEKEKSE